MAKIHRLKAMSQIIDIRHKAKTDGSLAEHVREIVDAMLDEEKRFRKEATVEHEINLLAKKLDGS